jgi:hypothetical protein
MWGDALAMNTSVELLSETDRLVLKTPERVHLGQSVCAKSGG